MNDDHLRALVRAAIAQHIGAAPPAHPPEPVISLRLHPSHRIFDALSDGASDAGPCVIEPAVACNHCGYCKSFGH